MWSLETSKCNGREQLAKFDLPALVVQSTGDMGVFPCDAEVIHNAISSNQRRDHSVAVACPSLLFRVASRALISHAAQ